MPRRHVSRISREFIYSAKPKEFYQNEAFNGYFAQVCGNCGIVSLAEEMGPDIFMCDLCRFKVKPVFVKELKALPAPKRQRRGGRPPKNKKGEMNE